MTAAVLTASAELTAVMLCCYVIALTAIQAIAEGYSFKINSKSTDVLFLKTQTFSELLSFFSVADSNARMR